MIKLDSSLPHIMTKFELGAEITPIQRKFLKTYGFLHFKNVASRQEVNSIIADLDTMEETWMCEGRKEINGIPLFMGETEDGKPYVQRFAFTTLYSDAIRTLVRDSRFEPIRTLVDEGARIGERENDGVVVNRYVNRKKSIYNRLGWHTDGLRDVFKGRMPQEMLNVGLHLDDCDAINGGLRLIPGTHLQGFWGLCFRKAHFIGHRPDPDEICIETEAGDLTIHDGRLWHRVARSHHTGEASIRRSMFMPYISGPVEEKDESSRTPPYHALGEMIRRMKVRIL